MKSTGMSNRGVERDQLVCRGGVVYVSWLLLACALPTSPVKALLQVKSHMCTKMHLHGSDGRTRPKVNTTQAREKTWHNCFYSYCSFQPFFVFYYSLYLPLNLEKRGRGFMNRWTLWVGQGWPLFPLSFPPPLLMGGLLKDCSHSL